MNIENEMQDEYRTTDLSLAGYLLVAGLPLLRVDPEDERRLSFVFRDDPNRSNLCAGFWNDTASVPPATYFSAMRRLKDLIKEYSRQAYRVPIRRTSGHVRGHEAGID